MGWFIMICEQCQELISDYIDGLLELGEQTKVESHLADCEPCRIVRDDLLQIVHFSQQLPEQAPSPLLWTRIQSEIAVEQPLGTTARAKHWWSRLTTRHFNLSLPQLTASAAALVIALSIGIMTFRHEPANNAQPVNIANMTPAPNGNVERLSNPELSALEQQIDHLSANIDQKKGEWTPELRDAYERNLLYVNQSLVECRHQIQDNPADDTAQELMLNAYREKVRLLEGFQNF
jgi:anti-sigma-K factor RskA